MKMQVQSLISLSGLRIGCYSELLCRPHIRLRSSVAVAMAAIGWGLISPIQPLAWELPYAQGAAVKKKKKKIIVAPATGSVERTEAEVRVIQRSGSGRR